MRLKKSIFGFCSLSVVLLFFPMHSIAEDKTQKDEILVNALQQGQINKVMTILDEGGNPNAMNKYGWSLLSIAAGNNNKEMTEMLINKGADVNAKNNAGISILHTVSNGEIANILISKGANINAKDKDGRTPLHWAANFNHKLVAKLLVTKGADINVKDKQGITPRVCAFVFDHKEIRSLLKNIEVESTKFSTNTHQKPLHIAKVFDDYVFPEDIAFVKQSSTILPSDDKPSTCTIGKGPVDWLDKYIFKMVRADFIDKNGLKATDDEILEMQESQDQFMMQDKKDRIKRLEEINRKLKNTSLSKEEKKNLEDYQQTLQNLDEFDKEEEKIKYKASIVELRKINAPWIEIWKFNKAAYQKYGGTVGITKFGPVPAGAIKSLLEDYRKQGYFEIYEQSLNKAFWKKYSEEPEIIAKPGQIDFTPFWIKNKRNR